MKRDDFTKSVIRTLREQVSYRCSNPDCRAVTAAAGNNGDGVNRVGQAAHITAASKGGPRYDSGMTQEERRSVANGIWLCNNCAKKIDNSPSEYPVELIRNWKTTALQKAQSELGKQLPSEDYAVNLLSAAMFRNPDNNIPQHSINNIHSAAEITLSQKYPGYNFKTKYENGITSVSINPETGNNIKLEFDASNPEDASHKYRRFIQTGKPIQFEIEHIRIDGPEILQPKSTNETALVTIGSATSKPSTLKLISMVNGSEIKFDDIVGKCQSGSDAIFFSGSACGDFIEASVVVSDRDDLLEPLNIKFKYDIWNKKSVRSLPYLNKITKFLNDIDSSDKVIIKLEVEGDEVFTAFSRPENFSSINIDVMNLIYKARDISIELDQEIIFDPDSLSERDEKNINFIHKNLSFERNTKLEKEPTLEIKFITEVKNLEHFNHMVEEKETQIYLENSGPKKLIILNKEIELPDLVQVFKSVKAEIVEEIEEDKKYEVKIRPLSSFEFWEGFNIRRNKKAIKKVRDGK